MAAVKSYRDLFVWQTGMALVTEVYLATKSFPREELYGLTSQIRRCAVSIPSNIAEGHGRNTTADYVRFLSIAIGSLYELQTQLQIARNLEYITSDVHRKLSATTAQLEQMSKSLRTKLTR